MVCRVMMEADIDLAAAIYIEYYNAHEDGTWTAVKTGFYSFFRTDAVPYLEVGDTLRELKRRGIKTES